MQHRSYNSSITATAMSMRTIFPSMLLDGKAVAEEIRDKITNEVIRMKDEIGVTPMLAFIIVGEKNHSLVHLENKLKSCEAAGIKTDVVCLPKDSSEEEVEFGKNV
ncbi:hypothetical protein MKX03_030981 [Papaver bracteatum]|nr:hypothetical protein MKX03_030981 [Papaver bracteatum]